MPNVRSCSILHKDGATPHMKQWFANIVVPVKQECPVAVREKTILVGMGKKMTIGMSLGPQGICAWRYIFFSSCRNWPEEEKRNSRMLHVYQKYV
ncbi:hypothetical protein TNCT_216251 [Trichonephila clavata]|uniref:Uncharacterized protein n=1 Tax=Trichonephila clavata TaxID=2740835 RepID=A0A8X6LW50_TRICU|nr:hypothetical protein TNCT_216251 [Trichonephila clavata]